MSFDSKSRMPLSTPLHRLRPDREFLRRHIGPDADDQQAMLTALGCGDSEELLRRVLPQSIRAETTRALAPPASEAAATAHLRRLAERNELLRCHIGAGYYPTEMPAVIRRTVLENPAWYTAYTPYQPEISQGRLEGLLHFQQLVMDLTGLDMANASMLDEATACAEAMAMSHRLAKGNVSNTYFVAADVHPQTLAVVQTRARHFGFTVVVDAPSALPDCECFGALLQYPASHGTVHDLRDVMAAAQARGALVTVAADPLALVLLEGPGGFGADMVVGSMQRFGVPMGFGGPHAAFFAFRERYKRSAPGRIIGVSKDRLGRPALRMAMQTREQHIRREKANSNICTSQVLLALISAFYAMYHGPEGLRQIALRVHLYTKILAEGLLAGGLKLRSLEFFDTLAIAAGDHQQALLERARAARINLRPLPGGDIGVSLDETCDDAAVEALLDALLGEGRGQDFQALEARALKREALPAGLLRTTPILTHPNFHQYHCETEMLRYLKRLQSRDLALDHAMIPLGSCTMKLNAASEMEPISWPEFANLHPFAPIEQAAGYQALFEDLERMLMACTGYDHVSLQPNAGSQGEYAGLVAIREYFAARGETGRVHCLIPVSAHGTNPATAQMAGLKVVLVACDADGNVDAEDLRIKVTELGETIAALMITYPSTHGVFEERVVEICEIAHSVGAQVYIDGANMNAMVGLAAPGLFGGDVSHLNLHKTFCIPHGGGGPGMGPIGVKAHLAPYLPGHPLQPVPGTDPTHGTISAAPWGSAGILPISWMYLRMMGAEGVRQASIVAILNANYVAHRLAPHYPTLYAGREGLVAHECLLDLRPLKQASGITEEDIAKRLMDYGYHAPTMSFPVPGTLMIEPTESESKAELDRFCDAMIAIRGEIARVESGEWPGDDNPLVNAPHTQADVMADTWTHPYSRAEAAEPLPYLKQHKVWPAVARVDNVYGDRNVMCACPPIESYQD